VPAAGLTDVGQVDGRSLIRDDRVTRPSSAVPIFGVVALRKHRRPPVRSPYRQSPWLIALAVIVALAAIALAVAALLSM